MWKTLILMAASEYEKILNWKCEMEVKGLKVNTEETKIKFVIDVVDRMKGNSKWPCSV